MKSTKQDIIPCLTSWLMAVPFPCDPQWQMVKQQTFASQFIIHGLLLLTVSTTAHVCQQSDFICTEKPLYPLPKFYHAETNKQKKKTTKLNHSKGSRLPPLPVTKQHLSETSTAAHILVTHTAPQQSFIIWSHKHLSSPADTARGCHCVLTGYLQWGRRLSTAGAFSKAPRTDPGSVEGASQLGKQYDLTQSRGGPHGCSNSSIIFRIYGCAASSWEIQCLGCTHQCV